jgi:hypothetical protein
MSGTVLWPSSEYAARCDACGSAIGSVEPRVRDDAPAGTRKRSWHPSCYERDPEGQAKMGPPRAPARGATGAPRVPRVAPEPSVGSSTTATPGPNTPSVSIAASPASYMGTPFSGPSTNEELVSVSCEFERTEDGKRSLVRLQTRVPADSVAADGAALRALALRLLGGPVSAPKEPSAEEAGSRDPSE